MLRTLLGCIVVTAMSAVPARAAPPDANKLRDAVAFSLQCNASLGTIEQVVVTGISGERNGLQSVRGTYRQKLGSLSVLHMHSADSLGGVFEGDYDLAAGKFRAIQFKISVRTGYVGPTCLR
jgi:hypothetical protein